MINNRGYSLIELIVSITMVLIVTGASVQVFRFADTHKNLTISADEFIGNLRVVQGRSLSFYRSSDDTIRHTCGFGIKVIDEKNYVVYSTWAHHKVYLTNPSICHKHADNSLSTEYYGYDEASILDAEEDGNIKIEEEFKLRKGVIFNGDSIGEDVFFLAPYSEIKTNSMDGFIFESDNGQSFSKTIKVNDLGMVQEQ